MNTIHSQFDDITLINGILANDIRCYRLFQKQYAGYIRHLFGRWINDTSDAEELACDVMMKVITSLDRFDAAKGNMRLWIYVIALNTRNDYLRKLAAREEEAGMVSLDEPVSTGSDILHIDLIVDNRTDGSEPAATAAYTSDPALAAAQEVINGLSADTRYILQMHEDGYTSSEIAETVHKPEGTIRSICSRIKKAIRAAYEKVMKRDEPAADVDTEEDEPADECAAGAAFYRTMTHDSRAESRDESLFYKTHVTPAVTIIRTLLSYYGAVYKRTRAA
ncbi:MAG: RNA polymerase sigma factor [Spirochaetes bacterium]|nr:RNA polymerase sigma factor [Spirochaetota bacterium]